MCKILAFLLISLALTAQTIRRSPETRKDHANVFYSTNYTLFDLFSDEPIFPDYNGKYDIIISSNENKSPQRFVGTGLELSQLAMYKFKNLETHRRWARGEIIPSFQQKASSSISQTNDKNDRLKAENPNNGQLQDEVPQVFPNPTTASGNLSYFERLVGGYNSSEINLLVPESKDKKGNFMWGSINDQNRDGFGILYSPGEVLQIGEFKDLKLDGVGLTFRSNGRLSIGNFKADELNGIGYMGFQKDTSNFVKDVIEILKYNTKKLFIEDKLDSYYIGIFSRNEKNDYVFDGKHVRNRFDEKSNTVKIRNIIIGRQIGGKPSGIVKMILETPAGGNITQGMMVYTGELDVNKSPKGSGFNYSISPNSFVRLSGEFNGFFEVNGTREHSSGIKHFGLIKNDDLVGEGRMEQDDKVIKGTFKDFLPHGKARIDYKNGDYFEGNFINGSAQGLGVSYNSVKEEKLSGNFNDGKANGLMKLTKGKKVTMETYVNGEKK